MKLRKVENKLARNSLWYVRKHLRITSTKQKPKIINNSERKTSASFVFCAFLWKHSLSQKLKLKTKKTLQKKTFKNNKHKAEDENRTDECEFLCVERQRPLLAKEMA